MDSKYIATKTTYSYNGEARTVYGVAVIDENEDGFDVIKTFSDLSNDKSRVDAFVASCNQNKLSMSHFHDAIEDFIME